jgi:transposase
VVERPDPDEQEQDLNLDTGYDNPRSREAAAERGWVPQIRRIGEEKEACDRSKGHKPRRWVVERTLAWLTKCRGIPVGDEKEGENDLGLIQMACGRLWYRRLHRMGRCDTTQNPT